MYFKAEYKMDQEEFMALKEKLHEYGEYYRNHPTAVGGGPLAWHTEKRPHAGELGNRQGTMTGWRSCYGNAFEVRQVTPGYVNLEIQSRRHGIPDLCREYFQFRTPTRVLNYETLRPDASVWETDLLKTPPKETQAYYTVG